MSFATCLAKVFRARVCLVLFGLGALGIAADAQAVFSIHNATGANAAAIQTAVDQFRSEIGAVNNGAGPPAVDGRREINWDGVPDESASPHFLAPDFFNATSPRGVIMHTIDELSGNARNDFRVSANVVNPDAAAVEFGDINPTYPSSFQPFSGQRIFHARDARVFEIKFFVPGTNIPATVKAFGVVMSDVDLTNNTSIRCLRADGRPGVSVRAQAANNGLSFIGVIGNNDSDRCASIVISIGTHVLSAANNDTGSAQDVVAMDDFIYSEPVSVFDLFENGLE